MKTSEPLDSHRTARLDTATGQPLDKQAFALVTRVDTHGTRPRGRPLDTPAPLERAGGQAGAVAEPLNHAALKNPQNLTSIRTRSHDTEPWKGKEVKPMTETKDLQRIRDQMQRKKDLQYCLDWLDGEQFQIANALTAELGSSHPLVGRYVHMVNLHRVVTTYVMPN